eukprot:1199970-Rhodomonas_salina.1
MSSSTTATFSSSTTPVPSTTATVVSFALADPVVVWEDGGDVLVSGVVLDVQTAATDYCFKISLVD